MLKSLFLIGVGSFIGGVSRFALSRYVQSVTQTQFPWGTWIVNISGCFIIGILFGLSMKDNLLSNPWKLFLITGICGGYTTFSSFSLENLELIRAGYIGQFLVYSGSSVLVGLLATLAGFLTIRVV